MNAERPTHRPEPVTIRPYAPDDLDGALDAWHAASVRAHAFLDTAFIEAERRAIAERWLPASETWVAARADGVVGFVSRLGDTIAGPFVHPRAQRSGVGRALMERVRGDRATLEADVFEKNEVGSRFYARTGFRELARRVDAATGERLVRFGLGVVPVVAAVIRDGETVLLARRPADKRHGGRWEFPGGKLADGETPEEGARRELREELAVDAVAVGPETWAMRDAGSPYRIAFHDVRIVGEPDAIEHDALAWVPVAELHAFPLAPTDEAFARARLGRRRAADVTAPGRSPRAGRPGPS